MKKITLIIFYLLLVSSLNIASAETRYQWRLAETWSKDSKIFGGAVQRMAKLAYELSNGKLVISTHSQEIHKKPLGVFNLVQSGEYQMGHSASYYWKDRDINTLFFTTLPLGMIATEQYAWFYHGGGLELMQKAYARHGMLSFPGGNTGNQMGGWFRKEIKSLDDMKGLKMNIPGLAGDAIIKLGVQSVNLPDDKLYTALESGEIDALEWVGPSHDLGMGFHRVAPYYYTGWHEPATELQFLVNQKAYNALPKELQSVLRAAMRLAAYDMYIQSYHVNINNLKKMRADYPNIKIRSFPSSVIRELRKQADWQLAELAEFGSPLTKDILESLRSYRDKARVWTRISDQAYLNNVGL
ncbi:MAG: TRAP transporter substrate-binding protein [Arenicella sp.]